MSPHQPLRHESDTSSPRPAPEPGTGMSRNEAPTFVTTATTSQTSQPTHDPVGSVPMTISASERRADLQQPSRPPVKHEEDALQRVYPKPEKDIDVAEALAREPLKWTLGHWKKNARDLPVPASSVPFTDVSKKRFKDTKEELRRMHAELMRLKTPTPEGSAGKPQQANSPAPPIHQ